MHSINIIILILLIACLLPYAFSMIARFSLRKHDKLNEHPRQILAQATGLAARANAAQQNSFEGLPLFITAILMADYLVVPDYFMIVLGFGYIVLRILYGICYLINWSTLRSIFWLLATLCPVSLLLLCIKLY